MCLTTDYEIDDIVNGDNVSCSGIAVLSLPGGLVPCGVLESCIANKQAMHLQEVCKRCTVPVPGAARMLPQGQFVCLFASQLAIEISCYYEERTRGISSGQSGKLGEEVFL